MCKSNGELADHLFLHYPIAMDLWSMVLGLFGLSWVMPHSVLGLLGCWQGSFGRHRNGFIWSVVPHGLMWCLWRERNSRCFEDIERSFRTSSFSFLQLCGIGCLLCKKNLSLLFLISQILAIFVFDLLSLCSLRVYQGVSLLISIYHILLIKKKEKKTQELTRRLLGISTQTLENSNIKLHSSSLP